MAQDSFDSPVPCIIGPTAVGKTAAALVLARQRGWEIISADSRQVYRFLDVGTAKPGVAELASVPHHFINVRNPDEIYSAGDFAREARARIAELLRRGITPLVVGGSGLYIRALVEGFFEPPVTDRRLQMDLKLRAQREGGATLHAELQRVDAVSAARLHPHDAHRIVRALEVYYTSGQPLSAYWRRTPAAAPFAFHFIGLTMPRDQLYARIHYRVESMLAAGLVEECRKLVAMGYTPDLNALQTVGYAEVFAFLAGRLNGEEMAEAIKQHTRNYAKRQLTWFRKNPNPPWIEIAGSDSAERVAQAALDRFEKQWETGKRETGDRRPEAGE